MSDTEAPTRKKRHIVKYCVVGASVIALVPMVVVALARLTRMEDSRTIVLLETFIPYLFLPAYGIAVFALLSRVRWLALVALLVVACHFTWVVVPEWRPASDIPDAARNAPELSLFSQNILYDNPTPEAIANSISELDADVVFLQEAARGPMRAIEASGALDRYEYEIVEPGNGPEAIGIWSKLPLLDARAIPTTQFPALRAVVEVNGKPVVLWNIHTRPPPIEAGTVDGWQADLREVRRQLHNEQGSVVAAGDFNAVYSHRPYRQIVANGYLDAHIDRGRGIAVTWPASGRLAEYGGAIRIDHVLTRGDARAKSISEMPGNGSDHRGLHARVAVW